MPYLGELIVRSEEFYRLRTEKQIAGANLSNIEPIRLRVEDAFRKGDIPLILELMAESSTLLQGRKWDEKEKFLASLAIELDRAVVEPNAELQVTLARIFPSDMSKAFAATPVVTFEIIPLQQAVIQDSNSQAPPLPRLMVAEKLPIAETGAAAGRRLKLSDGAYWVVARIEDGGQKAGEVRKLIFAVSNFAARVTELSKRIDQIKKSSDPKVKAVAGLVTTSEFQLQRLAPLNRSRSEVEVIVPDQLEQIASDLSELEKGNNPYTVDTGEIERAYAAADGKLVPFRLYVPESYDGHTARPLVVMLHGALGDERSYLSGLYDPAVIKGEADKRGWILAAPNGRGRLSGYEGAGRDDVLAVVKAVSRDYRIDAARVYLTGHSMGGFGTWTVAASDPETFAAIAPVSGGPPQQGGELAAMLEKIKGIPAMVIHGAKDGIVPPSRSRDMVAAAKKAGLTVEHIEVANADHITVVAATFPAVMGFFEKHAKSPAQK